MNEEYIDFEKEIQEFIIKKYVKKIETLEKEKHYCIFQLITLENDEFTIRCSVSEGIQVLQIKYHFYPFNNLDNGFIFTKIRQKGF